MNVALFTAALVIGLPWVLLSGAEGLAVTFVLPARVYGVSAGEILAPIALFVEFARWPVHHRLGELRKFIRSPTALLGVGFLALAAVSGIWSRSGNYFARDFGLLVVSSCMGLAAYLFTLRLGARRASNVVCATGIAVGSIALVWQLVGRPDMFNLQRVADPNLLYSMEVRLGHPFIGLSTYFATVALLFLTFAIFAPASPMLRIACGVLSLTCLVWAGSRGANLAAFVAIAAGLLLTRGGSSRLKLLLWSAFGLGAAGAVAVIAIARGFEAAPLFNDPARSNLRSLSIDFATQKPLLGWGWGSWHTFPGLEGGTHNFLLTVLLELGLVGLILGLVFIAAMFKHLMSSDASLRPLGVALLVGVVLNCLVEASFEGAYFQELLFFAFGIVLGARPELKGTTSEVLKLRVSHD